MRITCVIHSLQGGGAERLMAGLASRLAADNDVSLVTLDAISRDAYPLSAQVKRLGLGLMAESHGLGDALANNSRRIRLLGRAISQTRPEVVLSFCDKTNVLVLLATLGMRTEREAVRRKLPVVISEHTDPRHQSVGKIWSWLRKRAYPRAAAGIALTTDTSRVLRQWTKGEVEVIPPAIDPPRLKATPSDHQTSEYRGFHWVCAGRLSPEKGFDRALRAIAQLRDRFPNCRLTIAGEGAEREALETQIREANLGQHVRLAGWVQDTNRFFAEADGFLLTSHYEGFPLGLLEAMSSGLCCVAMDCQSGPSEVIVDGENGLLVPASDVDALVAGMTRVMSEPGLAAKLGASATIVADQYDWDRFVEAHRRVLERVTGHSGGAASDVS